jgi:hypothetical protein
MSPPLNYEQSFFLCYWIQFSGQLQKELRFDKFLEPLIFFTLYGNGRLHKEGLENLKGLNFTIN